MAKFHVFTFSGNTMMMKLSLQMIKGPEDDEEFAFFKSRTLYMPYANQPVETLAGATVDLATLKGDWLLIMPTDVVPHLRSSGLWGRCNLVADVEVGMFYATAIGNALLKFIHENWGRLTSTD